MKQTVTSETFKQAFHASNRYDQFGYQALNMLFEHFEGGDPDMELDVIAICCEYAHATVETIARDYLIGLSDCEDEDEKMKVVGKWLNDRTYVVGETDFGFVFCTNF